MLKQLGKNQFNQYKTKLNKVKAHKLGSNAIILTCGGMAPQQGEHTLANHY
jgi:hypothetical protein